MLKFFSVFKCKTQFLIIRVIILRKNAKLKAHKISQLQLFRRNPIISRSMLIVVGCNSETSAKTDLRTVIIICI